MRNGLIRFLVDFYFKNLLRCLIMWTTKSLDSFIRKPTEIIKECKLGPVEITGGDQSYVVMTSEFLRRLLTDSYIAANLDKIIAKFKNNGEISKNEILKALETR